MQDLLSKADPLQDDWSTERLWTNSKKQLSALGELLSRAEWESNQFTEVLDPNAQMTSVDRDGFDRKTLLGRIDVVQPRGDLLAKSAMVSVFEALRKHFALLQSGGRPMRLESKIVRVRGVSEQVQPSDQRWVTEVRMESTSKGDADVREQTAYWDVTWYNRDGSDYPLIEEIRVKSFEEIVRPRPAFEDRTWDVIRQGWDEQLRHGGEYWHGRVDAVGEINYFGHNGIAIGDVNGDGLEDLYVALGTGLPNKLFLHQPDGTVREAAAEAGVAWLDDTKGVLLADMDNDADQDLLCAIGPTIVLCKNDGKGRFTRFVSMKAPEAASFYSLCVADYDLDGDLDIYGTRYVHVLYGISVPSPFHDANNGPSNHLMRNDGDDRYVDVTGPTGLNENNTRFSTACAWQDYDNDGDPDLYVTNDFGRNNLYRNDGGRFVDVAARAGAEDQAAGMGAAWSDFDLDGDFDLYVSNMFSSAGNRIAYQPRFHHESDETTRGEIQRHSQGNTLLRNEGDGTFRDVSDAAGVRMGRWAWGAKFVDLNNDGWDDLVVPNGFLTNDRKDDL